MKQLITISALAFVMGSTAFAANPSPGTVPADNTGKNARDTDRSITPLDQSKGTKADVEITRKIRDQITSTDGISTNGKNVKIITLSGVVTLRGPVESQSEKDAIAKVAMQTAGVTRVDNALEVKTR